MPQGLPRPLALACLLVAAACGPSPSNPSDEEAGPEPWTVLGTLEIGQHPHGIRFSGDGRKAWVALSGDDQVAVVDLETLAVERKIPAGSTPLDLIALESGGWAVTQFRGSEVLTLGEEGPDGPKWEVGSGPSLFAPRQVGDLAYLVSEHADRLTLFDTARGEIRQTFPTGKRPYPADVTRDGILAFIPNRTDGTVSVIDLLNGETLATPEVCEHPEGGSLTVDDVSYIVACGGSDELAYINTASFEVTRRVTEGVGPRPFSVAVTPDGRFGVVNNAGGSTISILDVAAGKVLRQVEVGEQPIVVRMHPDGRRVLVSSEGSNTLSVVSLPVEVSRVAGNELNEVVILGAIHRLHTDSERYGIATLKGLIEAIDPDYVLAEIPPNRFPTALRQFEETGEITEPRVARFPEYVDALFPLSRHMRFEIIPAAAWTAPMAEYRRKALDRLESDPARADEWRRYLESVEEMQGALAEGGEDDPMFIHSEAYNEASEISLRVYNRFNDELGPGGWDNINAAHWQLIAQALDAHRGEGKRFLIVYGAGHKGWFLRKLRERDDVKLVGMEGFLAEVLSEGESGGGA